jgi:hypothetical protein
MALVAALVLVVVVAGTALAASRGAPWRLGYVETLTGFATGISGSNAYDLLRILNADTSATARALRAEAKSSSVGAAYLRNSGGGPAANFVVNAGKAPFTVNTGTKVTNLNADLLDGLDSTLLQRDATIRRSTELDMATGAAGTEIDWVSFPITQPAGRTLASYVGEARVTVPSTCSGGSSFVHVYLDDDYWGGSNPMYWTAQTANTEVTIRVAIYGGPGARVAQTSNVGHTLALKVVDECSDGSNWTYTSAAIDVIILG